MALNSRAMSRVFPGFAREPGSSKEHTRQCVTKPCERKRRRRVFTSFLFDIPLSGLAARPGIEPGFAPAGRFEGGKGCLPLPPTRKEVEHPRTASGLRDLNPSRAPLTQPDFYFTLGTHSFWVPPDFPGTPCIVIIDSYVGGGKSGECGLSYTPPAGNQPPLFPPHPPW